MLENLHVENLALIEKTDIAFGPGLNILSGETGAGKSIILGALHLALGGKVSKDMLRNPQQEAYVEAVFSVKDPSWQQQLKEMDVEVYDDEVILSRRITETRTISKINGETVPAQKMKLVGDILIDIYGQQEHQSLAHKKKHMELLDAYGKAEIAPLKQQVKEKHHSYIAKKKELEEASMDERQRSRELDFLLHEAEEIEQAQLVVGEDEELETLYRKLVNGKRILEAVDGAYEETGGDDGASDKVSRAIRSLSGMEEYDENLGNLLQALAEIDDLISDVNRSLAAYREDEIFDERIFVQTEERLDLINRLKAKYGNRIEDILEAGDEKRCRIQQLESYDEYITGLQQEVEQLKEDLQDASSRLSKTRQKYASQLCQRVREALLDLNFLDVVFDMKFDRLEHYTQDGFDDAEFLISTNPGEPAKPLKNIASGGEMSRIMLAMKTILAQNDGIDTLIFDEIDSGISGRTAQAVSEKLSLVAREHQVICITHLPQIAAMADRHFLIEKSVEHSSTVSKISRLSREESIAELARMLGGTAITQTVLDNAKEMKELADNAKAV